MPACMRVRVPRPPGEYWDDITCYNAVTQWLALGGRRLDTSLKVRVPIPSSPPLYKLYHPPPSLPLLSPLTVLQ